MLFLGRKGPLIGERGNKGGGEGGGGEGTGICFPSPGVGVDGRNVRFFIKGDERDSAGKRRIFWSRMRNDLSNMHARRHGAMRGLSFSSFYSSSRTAFC